MKLKASDDHDDLWLICCIQARAFPAVVPESSAVILAMLKPLLERLSGHRRQKLSMYLQASQQALAVAW